MRFAATLSALLLAALVADARQIDSRRARAHNKRFHRRSSNFTLADMYQGESFFDGFDFYTDSDPTHGQVEFVAQSDPANLAYVQDDGTVVMKVDNSTDLAAGASRKSVRVSSKKTYSTGLIILDAFAMPHGCGTWPAFWMVGSDWPNNGEIDIMEGVNAQTNNQMTLHTSSGCSLDQSIVSNAVDSLSGAVEAFTAAVLGTTCESSDTSNDGCAFSDTKENVYGHGFNVASGGVMATLIDDSGISIYHFQRDSIPADITAQTPNPSGWGTPSAYWSSSTCDIGSHFNDMSIVFDTTLCGDWAGADGVFSATCSGTCSDAVATASNFDYAAWQVNYVAVYN